MDRYTKVVLTVIAFALVVLVAQNATRPALADMGGCGTEKSDPCYVATGYSALQIVDTTIR